MIENQSIAVHAFAMLMLLILTFYLDEILLPRYVN